MTEDGAVFVAPRTLGDVYRVLQQPGPASTLLAGGLTLLPMLNRGIGQRDRVVSLGRVAGLDGIEIDSGRGRLRIGATATHTVIAGSPLVQRSAAVLAKAAGGIGDVQVRNRGTIGGVIAYGNAGADYLTVLSALEATVLVGSAEGVRSEPIGDFLIGFRETDLRHGEVVTGVELDENPPDAAAFHRYYRVQGASPTITAAAARHGSRIVLAVGGATPRPVVVVPDTGGGRDAMMHAALDAACAAAPFGDPHNPPDYRRAMAAVFARRVVEEASA
jgi:carbon-monoxide dehydrogenase medium subunit